MLDPPPQLKQLKTFFPFFGTSSRSERFHFHGNR